MKRITRLFIIPLLLLMMVGMQIGLTSCHKDDKDDDMKCYDGYVTRIIGNVVNVHVDKLQNGVFKNHFLYFNKSDMKNVDLFVGCTISFKIIDYERERMDVIVNQGPYSGPTIRLHVKPC